MEVSVASNSQSLAAETPGTERHLIRQHADFRNGNEAAALAARDIGFHLMGYFPITPSTEVAESLSEMQAEGRMTSSWCRAMANTAPPVSVMARRSVVAGCST